MVSLETLPVSRMAPTRLRISLAALLVNVTSENFVCWDSFAQQVSDPGGDHAGFPGPSAGKNQNRPSRCPDRFELLWIQIKKAHVKSVSAFGCIGGWVSAEESRLPGSNGER